METRNKAKKTWVDTVLILFGVSSVFGIMNFMKNRADALSVIFMVIFAVFWLYMAFQSGREKSGGFIAGAAILWGVSLLILLWNAALPGFFAGLTGVSAKIMSYAAFIMLLFFYATSSSVLSGLAGMGIVYTRPAEFLLITLGCVFAIAAAYLLGFFRRKREDRAVAARRAEILKKN